MSTLLFAVLAVVAVAGAEALYYFVRYLSQRKDEELRRRLRVVGQAGGAKILRARRLAKAQWLSDALSGLPPLERLEKLLMQTDLELTVARLLALSTGLAALGVAAGVYLRSAPVGLLGAAVGAAAPLLWVFSARQKRSARVSDQLPDALEMMARSIKAGHALPASLKLVASECPAPVAVEFAGAFEQQNLGLPFEQAILNMCERVPSNLDLRLFAVSVNIQKETGGNLVEVLENISSTLRERFKFYSKLQALTAEGRISGIILGSLPFVVAFLVYLTNPDYLATLNEGLGRVILVGGMVSWTVGIFWMKSLAKVDY